MTIRRSPGTKSRATSTTATVDTGHSSESRCQRCKHRLTAPQSVARSHGPVCWTRRRDTAVRVPLLDCGCADPWVCKCRTVLVLSDNQLNAWADTARYVIDTTGCTPMVPVEVLRRLWNRGGDDRALAEKLRAAGGAVA